jgi:uncharacterized protein (TIGR04255 family)
MTIPSRSKASRVGPGIVLSDGRDDPVEPGRPLDSRPLRGAALSGPPPLDDDLPEFGAPPVVEVVLGVQFRPLFGLRPIELAPLREQWRESHPLVQEQPPLPPAIEQAGSGLPTVQFVVGPALQSRTWFLSDDQSSLVQLQHDRLTINWRQTSDVPYPRYPAVRQAFEERSADLSRFVADRRIGDLMVTQAEVTYINAVDTAADEMGDLGRILRHWDSPSADLGKPEQGRCAAVFGVPDIGRPPVRLYVAVDPAQRPDGRPALFLTLTVRGAPAGPELADALRFMDQAHAHVVRSFTVLTPDAMHALWERHR